MANNLAGAEAKGQRKMVGACHASGLVKFWLMGKGAETRDLDAADELGGSH
jgi:hypothetical protein